MTQQISVLNKEMCALIKMSVIFTIIYWVFSNINFVRGKRPDCLAKEGPDPGIFHEDHFVELGFTRDVCVELVRKIYQKIDVKTKEGAQYCQALADMRTSICFCGCRKWKRDEHRRKHEKLVGKALYMMQNLNNYISQRRKQIQDVDDQKDIIKYVDEAVKLLTDSKALEGENESYAKLMTEIKRVPSVYCKNYLKQLEEEKEKAGNGEEKPKLETEDASKDQNIIDS